MSGQLLVRSLSLALLIPHFADALLRNENGKLTVRVMSFNTWNTGANVNDGVIKIARHVLDLDVDIVAFQEINDANAFNLVLALLGKGWRGFYRNGSYPDDAIMTKHDLIQSSIVQLSFAVGARIMLKTSPPIPLNFWSVHADWRNYGPYAACNKFTTESFQIDAGEYDLTEGTPGRVQNMQELSQNAVFRAHLQQADDVPMFLLGDFNAPSHLDWSEAAVDLHCGWAFEWPTSVAMVNEFQMIDAYRQLHPDVINDPGTTWSTVQKQTPGWGWLIPEPQDRIDFIYYKGKKLEPKNVYPYQGAQNVLPKPYVNDNDWPSDHFGVVGDFELTF